MLITIHTADGAARTVDAFEESKHPRGNTNNAGQFSSTPGAGVGNAVAATFSKHGFKKQKSAEPGHFATYKAPNGVTVHVHHPKEGKKAASEFTSHATGHTPKTGHGGAKLEELLAGLTAREAPTVSHHAFKVHLNNLGYSVIQEGGGVLTAVKGANTIEVTPNGEWVSSSTNHLTKAGEGLEDLDALVKGKPGNWKNVPAGTKPGPAAKAAPVSLGYSETGMATNDPEHVALLKKLAAAAPTDITWQESLGLKSYVGSGYTGMNANLRDANNPTLSTEAKAFAGFLERARIPEEVTLYRGVRGDFGKHVASTTVEGSVFRDRGFLSTSTNEKFSEKWAADGIRLKIRVPKGSKGAAVSHIGGNHSESEVVFQHGSKMVVTKEYDPKTRTIEVDLITP